MKKFLINLVLESVFDALLRSLQKLSRRSDNKLDDDLLRIIRSHRGQIIQGIKDEI